MISRLIQAVCVAVLCIDLTLGLWPFHGPRNDVSWLGNRNGLYFGRFGAAFSSTGLRIAASPDQRSGSLEIWLQPRRIWDSGTFLAFCTPANVMRLSLRQTQSSFLLRTAAQAGGDRPEIRDLYVDRTFRENGPVFITVTSGARGTAVYVDGAIAKKTPAMTLSAQAFAGRIILGDAAGQADSWSGRFLGFSIYGRELTAAQVLEHYETWTRQGRPKIAAEDANAALYLLDERTGRVIHSKTAPGPDLYIPEKYTVLGQIFLESAWSEFQRSHGFWGAVAKNIVGFVPFGFCFYAYFSLVRRARRAALATVVLGFGVSLTIEVLQWFLPMRDSGMMDLISNTLGTWIGVWLYHISGSRWDPGRISDI